MQIVLDSVSLNHLLRTSSKKSNKACVKSFALNVVIKLGKVKLAIDGGNALIDEWARTVGVDVVKVLVTEWSTYGGIIIINPLGRFSNRIRKQLQILQFEDAVDKLIVKIAMRTKDRVIVSDDSDYWDPSNKKNCGNRNAPVFRILSKDLKLDVWPLGVFVKVAV